MTPVVGQPLSRVDGRAKVTGAARYTAEFDVAGLAHAALVTSTIPSGRITAIDVTAAVPADGVLAVITHENAPRLPYRRMRERPETNPAGHSLRVFQSPAVLFSGQPIAVVVAETLEQARHAATLVRVTYKPGSATTTFDAREGRPPSEEDAETRRGAAARALAEAPVRVDHVYVEPREHHNAMELHATIASWDGDRLTLRDKTQWVRNVRTEIAHVFGIPDDHVRVISPFVGGAFGAGLRMWPHVVIAALAAREVRRPVRLELTRRELYTSVGFRPHTEQRVALGARRDGRLSAVIHETTAQTSSYEEYVEEVLTPAQVTYACPNVRTRYRLVEMDTNTPVYMRAPGTATGVFALETAMDELAVRLGKDPIELRLRNYAQRDFSEGKPWSSNELRTCYRVGAERFGWSRRPPEPRSTHDGDWLVGYGMATTIYPAYRSEASASATLLADGTALVRSATADMGPGTWTSMTQVAAETLGLPIDKVRFELGNSEFPDAPAQGGSMTMASVGNAVRAACEAVRARAATFGARLPVTVTVKSKPGEEAERYSSYAFGAVFAEVRVDAELGMIRVPRLVGAYDIGRVVNPKLARSQAIGGLVGGLGMAVLERADWDRRFGRVMNANFAEYLVPVNADIGELDVTFVPGDDRRFNPLGVKGVAELSLCGVAAAIGNAIYHATGVRLRELPFTLDRLL